MHASHFILLALGLVGLGCASSSSSPFDSNAAMSTGGSGGSTSSPLDWSRAWPHQTCTDFELVPFGTEALLNNNVWGKEDLTDYEQCVVGDDSGESLVFGWRWRWPTAGGNVKGYPEIMMGRSPFVEIDTHEAFPAPTDTPITVSYSAEWEATGTYNFAIEYFFVSDPEPTPNNITAEVMLWMAKGNMQPAGTLRETLTLNDVAFDVYVNEGHEPGPGSPSAGWNYIAFVAQEPTLEASLELLPLTRWAIDAGLVGESDYYTGVETGTEVIGGEGAILFESYSVVVGEPASSG